jgi:SAM-dependent methyltransferase
MDIRDSRNPGVALAKRSLDAINARQPWNHNDYFHGWIVRNLPERRRLAVDVGCGRGMLVARLAPLFDQVTGIDRNEAMVAAASERLDGNQRVSIRRCDFAEFARSGEIDLITMVASLHHMDLDATLTRIPGLLAPGGRLLVVGLARPESVTDWLNDIVSGVVNPVMGMIKHPRAVRPSQRPQKPPVPIKDPTTTLAEIRTTARKRLPGAIVRRRLYFRYTLRWDKPE